MKIDDEIDGDLKDWARERNRNLGDGGSVIDSTLRAIRNCGSEPANQSVSWRVFASIGASALAAIIVTFIWTAEPSKPEPPVNFAPKRAVLELDRYASLFTES